MGNWVRVEGGRGGIGGRGHRSRGGLAGEQELAFFSLLLF